MSRFMTTRLAGSLFAGLLATCAATAQSPIVGIWMFDETSGTSAADIGPYGNTGTLNNFTVSGWVPGNNGNALMFDGVDDYVDIAMNGGLPFSTGYGEPFTVSFWVNGAAQDDDRVLALSSSFGGEPLLTVGTGRNSNSTTSKLQIFRRSDANSTFPEMYTNGDVFDSTWHHVCYVEHGSYARIYIDGQLDLSFPVATGSQFVTTDILTLGSIRRPTNSPTECCHWTGMIDDLQIYSYAASATDIATLAAGGFLGTPRASVATFGVGCDAGNPAAFGPFTMNAFGSPTLGGVMELRTSGGQANSMPMLMISIGDPVLFDLAPFGAAPGCTLFADPGGALTGPMPPHDMWGSSVVGLPLPLPNIPLLAGLRITIAALDTAPNIVATNAVLAVLAN